MKLDREIKIGDNYGYPTYPLIDENCLYVGIRYSNEQSQLNSCDRFEFKKYDLDKGDLLWSTDLDSDLLCSSILSENMLILVTDSKVQAIDKNDNTEIWKLKIKNWNSHLSIINGVIYLVNNNSITRIDLKTGKKIDTKKYRVKWLDSPVVNKSERLFISTASSKIIEIDKSTLEIVKEYKYPGGWAIASTPVFFNNQIISNSYASYVTGFNIDSAEIIWRVKKEVGKEPKQLLSDKDGILFYCENLGDFKISAVKLPKGKKLWTKEYHVDKLVDDSDTIKVIAKDETGQYFLGDINKKNGEFKEKQSPTDFKFDDKFQYRLWNGADLIQDDTYLIACYSPNEIYVYKK